MFYAMLSETSELPILHTNSSSLGILPSPEEQKQLANVRRKTIIIEEPG